MLSNIWRRLAMVAAMLVAASAFTTGALAAGNPVPANLKAQILKQALDCRQAFKPKDGSSSCTLTDGKDIRDLFKKGMTAKEWSAAVAIDKVLRRLCYAVAPDSISGLDLGRTVEWTSNSSELTCYWTDPRIDRLNARHNIVITVPAAGHKLRNATCGEINANYCDMYGKVLAFYDPWEVGHGDAIGGYYTERGEWAPWGAYQIRSYPKKDAASYVAQRDDWNLSENIRKVLDLPRMGF